MQEDVLEMEELELDGNFDQPLALGVPGPPGPRGPSGIAPHIGANGNWFIGETDTGVAAGGNEKETVYVNVVQDSNGKYTADKTMAELLEAYNNGHTLMCKAHMDGTVFHIPFLATYEEEGVPTMVFTAETGGSALSVTMLDWLGSDLILFNIVEPEIPEFTPQDLTLKIGNYAPLVYNGTEKKSLVIPDVKNPYPLTINGVSYDGSESVDINLEAPDVDSEEVNELIDTKLHSVTTYGAKGDGSTDDTQAFQNALAENRVVTVPGGTYILSGALVIRENCCLELSQDTVLKFTQTSGYAIEMRSSATLRGNHAIISVPYEFTGSVIAMDTVNDGEDHNSIPPYTKAGSNMFKRQRFIYDVNIIKPDSVGFCRSMDGNCNGTAIYMSAEGNASFRWMWGITMSGIRIAGGFSYGIRAANFDKPGDYEDNAWNHDMRIEAVIEACEIGVSLENCNGAHLAVTIQPYKAQNNGAIYAKHGVYLNDARFIDMIGSRVWDWNASNTLWTSGGQYQHLALIGNCRGLILDDFLVYESSMPIRDLIYTDTPGNFDKMTILQEPGNKWFKAIDGEPYFNDGNSDIRLAAKTDIDEYFVTDRIADFIDVLKTNIDKNGDVYGTASGYYDSKFDVLSPSAYHVHTGFIACKKGDTFYTDGVKIRDEGNVRVTFFDSEFNYITNVSGKNMISGNYYVDPIVSTERGFQLTVKNINDANINKIAYARFNFYASDVGDNPVMTVNEEIKYTQAGFLADGIKVKAENVIGGSTGGGISITGATVGQTVKIAEVDENGVPTAWLPTDFPSGGGSGGSGEEWKLLHTITLVEDTKVLTQDLGGSYNAVQIYFENLWCVEGTSGGISANVNGGNTATGGSFNLGSFINKSQYPAKGCVTFEKLANGKCIATGAGINSGSNKGGGLGFLDKDITNGITSVKFSLDTYASHTMNAGAVVNIYGR